MEKIDTFLMVAGGMGSRLWPMSFDKMKASLMIGGKSIVKHMLLFFEKYIETDNIVLSINEDYRGREDELALQNKSVLYLYEKEHLGTAGSFINYINSNKNIRNILIVNVDLILSEDLDRFFNFHREKQSLCTIFSVEVDDPSSYGLLRINSENAIFSFKEKDVNFIKNKNEPFSINGGLYFFSQEAVEILRARYGDITYSLSMEYDLLPWLVKQYPNRVYAYRASKDSYWLDLGSRKNFIKGSWDLICDKIGGYSRDDRYHFLTMDDHSIVEVDEDEDVSSYFASNSLEIRRSIIYKSVKIGRGSEIKDSIICSETTIPCYSVVESSVIGYGSNFSKRPIHLEDIGISGKDILFKDFSIT